MNSKRNLLPVCENLSPEELRARREQRIKREARRAKRFAAKRIAGGFLSRGPYVYRIIGGRRRRFYLNPPTKKMLQARSRKKRSR